jgi:PBSX family phage terminase large subunit
MVIDFKPTLKQHEAWHFLQDKTTTHILYGGSVGSGKSFLGCYWIFLSSILYPGSRYFIGRSRLNVLKRTTLKTLLDIIKTNNYEDKCSYNSQSNTMLFDNGSEIIFLDLYPYPADQDYDRLGSLEITGAFIDELSEISYKGFEVLYTRIRYKLNEFNITPKLFCASNPANGWPKNFFYKPYIDKEQKSYVKFIQALPTDNKYLPQSYLDGLSQTLTSGLKQRLLYGSWDFDSDDYALFQYDRLSQCFYNDYFKNEDTEKYLTCDIADLGNDRTVLSYWVGWSLQQMKILKQKETTQVVQAIKDLMTEYRIPINHIIVDSVGVGAGVASLLKGCVRYSGGEKTINNEKFRNIKTQLMYKFADKVNLGEVNFNMPYNDDIIQECLLYKKEFKSEVASITPKDEIKQRLGRSPDLVDSIYLRSYFDLKKKNNTSFSVL